MRLPLTCRVGLVLAMMVSGGRLEAETLELPTEWPLGIDSQLSFELDGADLHLTTRTDGVPVLRTRVAEADAIASLELMSSGGSLTVRRPDGGEVEAVRLQIDVVLGPGYRVHVVGTDLTVRAENTLPGSSDRIAIGLALERSTAKLKGVQVSRLEAVDSSVTLTDTDGALALTLTGGKTQLQGHVGRLELVTTKADVGVFDHQGQIVPDLKGGSLEIGGGKGTFEGIAADAYLSFDDWRGPVEVRADNSVVDALGGEHRDNWQIVGHELEVILERVWGTIETILEGGSLSGSALSAAMEVTAEGAQLDLIEVVGSITLDLTDGAEAVIAGVKGGVDGVVSDSRLEVERVDQLKLTGTGADLTAREIGHLKSLELGDSELALDLRDSRRDPILDLRGAGYANVQMKEPCIVQFSGAEAAFGSQIDVNGCELRSADEAVSRHQDRLKYGDVPVIRLTVSVGPDTVLEVAGNP